MKPSINWQSHWATDSGPGHNCGEAYSIPDGEGLWGYRQERADKLGESTQVLLARCGNCHVIEEIPYNGEDTVQEVKEAHERFRRQNR